MSFTIRVSSPFWFSVVFEPSCSVAQLCEHNVSLQMPCSISVQTWHVGGVSSCGHDPCHAKPSLLLVTSFNIFPHGEHFLVEATRTGLHEIRYYFCFYPIRVGLCASACSKHIASIFSCQLFFQTRVASATGSADLVSAHSEGYD